MHSENFYWKLVELENPEEEHRIQKDVTRTFTNYPIITQPSSSTSDDSETIGSSWNTKKGENMLFNILLAYANYDEQVGYVQGLNYIAAMLLMHIQDEEKVFWCMIYLLNRRNWRSIYMEDMPRLMDILDHVEKRLQKDYPRLAEHLECNGLTTAAAFSPFFITLYIYQIEHEYAMRIFEYFLFDGEQALFKVLFNMLDYQEERICSKTEIDLMLFLRTDIITSMIEE